MFLTNIHLSRSSLGNEWVASNRILAFAHGASIATHSKENVWQKVIPTSKKNILVRDYHFSAALWSEMNLGGADDKGSISFCLKYREICCKIYRLTCLHAQGLLWIWHRVMVLKFRKTSSISPKKLNKVFSVFGRVKSTSSFFRGLVMLGQRLHRGNMRLKWLNWALNIIIVVH